MKNCHLNTTNAMHFFAIDYKYYSSNKIKYSYIILTFLFFSCKTEIREITDIYLDGNIKTEYIYDNEKDKSNYTILEYHENGQIKFYGLVRNGNFVGQKINYFDNGVVREIDYILSPCALDFCCCDGKVVRYFMNGEFDQTFENRNGNTNELVSVYKRDSTGILLFTTEYKDDRKNGIEKQFYENGNVYTIQEFKNDSAVNFIYYFKENGDTLRYLYHFNGHTDFPTKKWLKNGEIFYADYVNSNYKEVIYRWTDQNGNEIRRQIMRPDKDYNYVLPD